MNTPVSFELAKLLKEKGYRILPDFKSSYPTIAEVVMWLYEKHGIWIVVRRFQNKPKGVNNILKKKGFEYVLKDVTVEIPYASPTEAYEAAIEYTLNNLI